ncbi:MAG TPA: SH3 domain-containing protein [Mesorhizobium sp.]
MLSGAAAQTATQPHGNDAPFFEVIGLADNDQLNVRAAASPVAMVIGRLPNGAQLRNHGCQMVKQNEWCKVEDVSNPSISGWTPGRYLMEVAADAIAAVEPPASAPDPNPFVELAIPCARYLGQPMGQCQASAEPGEAGGVSVTVAWPDGGQRIIDFRDGKPDKTDSPDDLRFTREGDLNMIRVGKTERFEVPDAMLTGE